MDHELPDPSETPRHGIARFLRGEVTDRFLGGVGFSAAAAMPVTREVNIGERVTHITDTIPAFTETIPAMTTTIPENTANFGRFITAQITEVTAITPTIHRTGDFLG